MGGCGFHVAGKACEESLLLRLDLVTRLRGPPCAVQGEAEGEVLVSVLTEVHMAGLVCAPCRPALVSILQLNVSTGACAPVRNTLLEVAAKRFYSLK